MVSTNPKRQKLTLLEIRIIHHWLFLLRQFYLWLVQFNVENWKNSHLCSSNCSHSANHSADRTMQYRCCPLHKSKMNGFNLIQLCTIQSIFYQKVRPDGALIADRWNAWSLFIEVLIQIFFICDRIPDVFFKHWQSLIQLRFRNTHTHISNSILIQYNICQIVIGSRFFCTFSSVYVLIFVCSKLI